MAAWAMRNRSLLLGLALLAGTACGKGDAGTAPTQSSEMSAVARAYLEQVLGIMQFNSIGRLTIDWASFRAQVFAAAPRAQTIRDTEPAIEQALRLLGDGHSSYRSPSGRFIFIPTRSCRASGAGTPAVPATIGYVKVGAFSGSAEQATAFANAIQGMIRAADHDSIIGWIVDVRGNGGGNMWPMIAGVGPVLGDDIAGYFIDPLGQQTAWDYRDGAARLGGSVAHRVNVPYFLLRERPKVAVLTDNAVASSGEATVIAFKKRPNTRSFGTATCGLSTANRGFTLSDGALLSLTVSVMADRMRMRYGDVVTPDEVIVDPVQAEQRAVAWLRAPN